VVRSHDLRVSAVKRAYIELFARSLEHDGKARATVARRLSTIEHLGLERGHRTLTITRQGGKIVTIPGRGRQPPLFLCRREQRRRYCLRGQSVGGESRVDVTIENFKTVETAFQFDRSLAVCGGVNRFAHLRAPVPLDQQSVIRMQRDTLYSMAIVDISAGAELTLPDAGDRYISAHVVNTDHYTNAVLHEPGLHHLTTDEFDTNYVQVSIRILADPNDAEDMKTVHGLQDAVEVAARSSVPYTHPDYDKSQYDRLYGLILQLGEFTSESSRAFGTRDEVDPIQHLINTAIGWGGLPSYETIYLSDSSPHPVGHYRLRLRDVPVDAFWSMSIYNRDGYFEANPFDSYNVNSVTARRDDDGSVVLDMATEDAGHANFLYVMDGWNWVFRLYQPRAEVLDGTWKLPEIEQL
jgi:hypothetical protein